MKFSDLTTQSIDQLHAQLETERAALAALRWSAREGQLKQVRKIRSARTAVSRLLTAINQKRVS